MPAPFAQLVRRAAGSVRARGLSGALGNFNRRFSQSIRRRGIMRAFVGLVRNAPEYPVDPLPPQPDPFDQFYGTDTGGFILGHDLSTRSDVAYLGCSPSSLTQALTDLAINYEDFTFIDLGCGKGRALLVAAQFPFRRLLGVEIAGELCDTARANATLKPDWAARISISQMDATKVIFPDGPLLLYFFNPFFAPVLREVLKNLERQLRNSPRPAFILYADNPRFTDVMGSFEFLKQVSDTNYLLSAEDVARGPFHRTDEWYTLYSADVTR